ncbi:MAG: NADP-dependent oxidoreductase [Hyphomonadaceae bacterium]
MKRWVLAKSVEGLPQTTDFSLREEPDGAPRAGEIAVDIAYHTVAPGIRSKMGHETYAAMIRPGDQIPGMGVGVVTASQHPKFAPGDYAWGEMAWATSAILSGDKVDKIDRETFGATPLYAALSTLGPSGLTAYFGLKRVAQVKSGELVLVSAAAGAVGSVVGQIARILGCRVVGIAGSDEKCAEIVREFGYHAAINYRAEPDLDAAIRRECPDGVDVYFDNVGGDITDAAFRCMKTFGRVAVCGQTAEYNATAPVGWREAALSTSKRLKTQGFIVFDYRDEFPAAIRDMSAWMQSGELVCKPTIVEGIENAASAFVSLFQPGGPGRVLVRTGDGEA